MSIEKYLQEWTFRDNILVGSTNRQSYPPENVVVPQATDVGFVEAADHFEANAQRDGLVECHGQLRAIASTLFNVSNNIRWLGAGPRCDGQVLVCNDLLGMDDSFKPRFVKRFAEWERACKEFGVKPSPPEPIEDGESESTNRRRSNRR